MPAKTTKNGQRFKIDGKKFVWTTDEDAEVTIPMRLKLKAIRAFADEDIANVATMFRVLEQIIPDQADELDEMDVNDFQAMFSAWQDEYTKLSGASLGE